MVWKKGFIREQTSKIIRTDEEFFEESCTFFVCGGGYPKTTLQKQGWQLGRKQTMKQNYQYKTTPPPNGKIYNDKMEPVRTNWNMCLSLTLSYLTDDVCLEKLDGIPTENTICSVTNQRS